MDLEILFFTVTYRIIHVTVMSLHSIDDNRKELRIKPSKMAFLYVLKV
jgi:hypothetical protein